MKDGYVLSIGKTQLRFVWANANAWLAECGVDEAEEESDE
jgi:hypothetical protein